MTNSINSQSLRKFLAKSRTCFMVFCVKMPICLVRVGTVCVCVCGLQKWVHQGWGWLTLNRWPALNTKTSHLFPVLWIHVFACWCIRDCQVTFRKPPLPISLSFNLFAMLKLHSCHFFLPPPSFSFTAEKQVHCDSECSSTAQWVLLEMRFERVSMREKDRTSSCLASWWIKDGGTSVL